MERNISSLFKHLFFSKSPKLCEQDWSQSSCVLRMKNTFIKYPAIKAIIDFEMSIISVNVTRSFSRSAGGSIIYFWPPCLWSTSWNKRTSASSLKGTLTECSPGSCPVWLRGRKSSSLNSVRYSSSVWSSVWTAEAHGYQGRVLARTLQFNFGSVGHDSRVSSVTLTVDKTWE